jgi:hypothetical protein
MRIQGALLQGRGHAFAVVIVKSHVISDRAASEEVLSGSRSLFPDVPIVLMALDLHGRPTCFGRRDIVSFLASVPFSAIPWKEYESA